MVLLVRDTTKTASFGMKSYAMTCHATGWTFAKTSITSLDRSGSSQLSHVKNSLSPDLKVLRNAFTWTTCILRWSLQVLNRPVWHSVFAGHMWEMTSRSQSGSSLAMSTLLTMTRHWHGISGNVMLRSSPRGCWSFKYRSVRGEDKTTASSAQTPALQRSMAEVKITYPHVRCSKCN